MTRSSHKSNPTPRRGETRGSPEVLADALMRRIFQGEFPPGTRLPPERQLAVDLGVDRTTLRMAVKQLQRMNLVVARHGSGIEVMDYREHGGLDVLAAMFALEGLPLDDGFLAEALDFWLESFSMTAARAIARMTLDDLGTLEKLLDRSIAAVGDPDAFVESELAIQDTLAKMSGSVIFRMLSNSTRPLRQRIMRVLPATVDMRASLDAMKRMLRMATVTRPDEATIRTGLLAALKEQSAGYRKELLLRQGAQVLPEGRRGARGTPRRQRRPGYPAV
jgi:GntR family transcriptional repressor for pyruvate dehydrogenase complex